MEVGLLPTAISSITFIELPINSYFIKFPGLTVHANILSLCVFILTRSVVPEAIWIKLVPSKDSTTRR
jgi:hypothetical protein